MAGAAYNRGASKQDYETPSELLEAMLVRWPKPMFDLAATEKNKKAPRCFTPEMDSLSLDWHLIVPGAQWCFLNPPFNNIGPWAAKCVQEARKGCKILFLVPASVGSNWFMDHVHRKAWVYPLNPRLSFDGKNPYPKDCMLCVYDCDAGFVGFEPWRWK